MPSGQLFSSSDLLCVHVYLDFYSTGSTSSCPEATFKTNVQKACSVYSDFDMGSSYMFVFTIWDVYACAQSSISDYQRVSQVQIYWSQTVAGF